MAALDPSAERVRTTNRILTALLILLALAASWHWVSACVQTWYMDRNWSHGFLILPLAGYLIWDQRDRLRALALRHSWLGVLLAALVLLVYFQVYYAAHRQLGSYAGWLLVFAVPLALFGPALIRAIWPALLFTILAVPFSPLIDQQIGTPLRKVSSTIAGFFLSLIPGLGLEVQGVSLQLRAGNATASLEVADACSGFTYLMAVLALGMFMAFSSRRALWQQLLISGSALPIALLTNAARIVLMGLACLLLGPESIGPAYHEWWGLAILPLALGLLVLECGVLERYFGEESGFANNATPDSRGARSEEGARASCPQLQQRAEPQIRGTEPQRDRATERQKEMMNAELRIMNDEGRRTAGVTPAAVADSEPQKEMMNAQCSMPNAQSAHTPTPPHALLKSPVYWVTAAILLLGAAGDYHFRSQRQAAEEALCIVPARTEPLRKPLAEIQTAQFAPFHVGMSQPLSDGTVRLLGSTDTVQLSLLDDTGGAAMTVNLIYYTGVGYIRAHYPEGCLPAVGYRAAETGENLLLSIERGSDRGTEGQRPNPQSEIPNRQSSIENRQSKLPARLAVFANDELHADQRAYTLMVNRQNGWYVANQQEANERLLKDGYLGNYLQIVIYAPGPDGHRDAFLRSAQRLLRVLLPVLDREFLPRREEQGAD